MSNEVVKDDGHIKVGRPDVSPSLSSHTAGVREGNQTGSYRKMKGQKRDGTSTAARSTGINADKRLVALTRLLLFTPADIPLIPVASIHAVVAPSAIIVLVEDAADTVPEIAPPVAVRTVARRYVLLEEQFGRRVRPVRIAAILEHEPRALTEQRLESRRLHPVADRRRHAASGRTRLAHGTDRRT